MIRAFQEADVVIGSRYVRGGKIDGWTLWRRLLSRGANFYARMLTGMPVRDCTSGMYLLRASQLRQVNLSTIDSSGYAFNIELKFRLFKNGARMVEVPITLRNRAEGESKISGHIIREGVIAPWKMLFKSKI